MVQFTPKVELELAVNDVIRGDASSLLKAVERRIAELEQLEGEIRVERKFLVERATELRLGQSPDVTAAMIRARGQT